MNRGDFSGWGAAWRAPRERSSAGSPRIRAGLSVPRAARGILLALLAVSTASPIALAGNLDAFYLSSDAAVQAGAITADAEGGGAIWYNPAGLADLSGFRLDVSVNGYAVRFGGQANLESGIDSAEVTQLTRIDLNVVPTALGITRNFGKLGVGVGAFVPTQSHRVLRTHFVTPEEEDAQLDFAFDTSTRVQQYHLGAAAGYRATRKLALGGAFFVTYQTLLENSDISLYTRLDGNEASSAAHQSVDTVQLGAEFVASLLWNVAPGWRIGGVTRFPALRLGEIAQRVETSQTASNPSGGDGTLTVDNAFSQSLEVNTSIINPFRFHLGVSHDFPGNVRGAVDASLLLPFVDERLSLELRPTYNARVGLKKTLGPRLAVGGGVFTDLSPNRAPKDFQDSQLNFFGLTTAVDLGTTYGVYAKNDQTFESPKALRFGTTIALSYAIGLGSVVQARLATDGRGGFALDTVPEDVVAHELTLHIGTTVME